MGGLFLAINGAFAAAGMLWGWYEFGTAGGVLGAAAGWFAGPASPVGFGVYRGAVDGAFLASGARMRVAGAVRGARDVFVCGLRRSALVVTGAVAGWLVFGAAGLVVGYLAGFVAAEVKAIETRRATAAWIEASEHRR